MTTMTVSLRDLATWEGLSISGTCSAYSDRINKYADPTQGALSGLGAYAAREIARVDPSLLWVEINEREIAILTLGSDAAAIALCDDGARGAL